MASKARSARGSRPSRPMRKVVSRTGISTPALYSIGVAPGFDLGETPLQFALRLPTLSSDEEPRVPLVRPLLLEESQHGVAETLLWPLGGPERLIRFAAQGDL